MTWRKAHDHDPEWELVDDDGRVWGNVEDVTGMWEAPKWTATLYGTGIIGWYVSFATAKAALAAQAAVLNTKTESVTPSGQPGERNNG